MEYKNDFDCPRFEADIFGFGRLPASWKWKPGWNSWGDVRQYFGLSAHCTDERKLQDGIMSKELHEALERKLGQELVSTYFPKPPQKKLSKEDVEIEDLATLIVGSINDRSKMTNRTFDK